MKLKDKYNNDITFVMSKRRVNGSDLWAGEDNNIGKGSPFSTRDVALILTELGFTKKDKIIKDITELIFENQQQDGRFRISKSGTIYPCHTIGCLRVLCYLGYAKDKRLKKTFEHLFSTQESDGGWKCNKLSFGKVPYSKRLNSLFLGTIYSTTHLFYHFIKKQLATKGLKRHLNSLKVTFKMTKYLLKIPTCN